jgi:ABC-2 type transport system ATP-binding protein
MSIEIKQITKYYGQQKAVDKLSFSLGKGELVGFLGPNGAGKSTVMKIITGFLSPDEGEVLVNGEKVTFDNVEVKRVIGYLPENNPLYTDLYVTEYLEIVAGFYHLPKIRSRVKEMIELTGLVAEQHKKIGALSRGFRQRVGLAQALIHNPSVLILDEPTSGLDPNQLKEIRGMISEISREKTVLLSSHILQEIEAICPRVVILNRGKLMADSDLAHLKEASISRYQQVFAEFDRLVPIDELIKKIEGVAEIVPEGRGWLLSASDENDIRPEIFRFAVKSGYELLTLTERQQNFESIFRQLTTENADESSKVSV